MVAGSANQIPSYVSSVPKGDEHGVYLAVDLGGTNLRVCSVHLHGDTTYTLKQAKHTVPRELRVNASYQPLFRFIAGKIKDFLEEHPEASLEEPSGPGGATRRQLGFTFSFTCEQDSLLSGTLAHWDKGWDIPDALGRNPCVMLQWAIDDLQLPVVVSALANDSVGTLMARSYTSGGPAPTLIGAIFGTGTNAAYVERLANVRKLHSRAEFKNHGPDDLMVINTEWGCFDEELHSLPSSSYDRILDAASPQPGEQMLEKRVGGLYLGELLRLAILQLAEAGLFDMTVDEDSPLHVREAINSSFLSYLAADSSESYSQAMEVVSTVLKAQNVSRQDAQAIRLVAVAIGRRAARIAGASLAAIILWPERHLPWPTTDVPAVAEEATSSTTVSPSKMSRFCMSLNHLLRKLLGLQSLTPKPSSPGADGRSTATLASNRTLMNENLIDVGVDGSLIEFYPGFEAEMRGALRDVPEIGPEKEPAVSIGMVKDGSALGAALMAQAAACQ